jgi:subtilase family serine protease
VARRLLLAATGVIALATAGLGTVTAQAAASSASSAKITTVHSCARASKGHASCDALARTDAAAAAATARMATGAKGGVNPNVTPSGFGPADLQSAYKLPSATAGSGQTVAIVDAYDDPTAESDLGVYRKQFGLSACTTANGCFKKVNQSGGSRYPSRNGGWAQEISLDLDMASAICPNCKILLVEASTASFANLGAAVNYAAGHANVISNSYGGSDASDVNYGDFYNHPGVAITVSSGDNGYGVEYPASSQFVTAVGGTHLGRDGSARGWAETAWSGAGSGCSTKNPQPSWQGISSIAAVCKNRAVADVSAVADPNSGVAVYDSTAYQGLSGWLVFGGTSVSSPIIASVYALAGNAGSVTYGSFPYSKTASLFDVASGSNGSCGGSVLCTARAGWDGPTGLGTPNGAGAF